MWYSWGDLPAWYGCASKSSVLHNVISSNFYTTGGQSGSPVFDDSLTVRALVNGGTNTATIHRTVTNFLVEWIKANWW